MTMNRVVNDPDRVVEDMLTGWLSAHENDLCARPDNPRVIQRRQAPERGKVGIVTGGGSGHEPAFLGYIGDGMVDAVAVGEVFSSPTAKTFFDAIRAADGGAGVACLYGNYAGDNMNVKLAMQMAEHEGIAVRTVIANDDVPSAQRGEEAKRRGVAGEILMWKVGAAKAALGGTLDEVISAAAKAIANTRSIGVGLSACIIPAVGKANFSILPGTMEVGIGHHGEPGVGVRATCSAAQMAELMLNAVLPDLPFRQQDRVAVLISGLGATPLMEQYILYGEVARSLDARGFRIASNFVGNLFTSLEMVGVTLTLMKLDEELEACLNYPCNSVGMSVRGRAHPASMSSDPPRATDHRNVSKAKTRNSSGSTRTLRGATIDLDSAGALVRDLIAAMTANREYLSEIDGLIGDGDHGVNMAKGFSLCANRLDALGSRAANLPLALEALAQSLLDDIGGSMGPLYGSLFLGIADVLHPHSQLDASLFTEAIETAVAKVQEMGNAQVGDKTMMDTLIPARDALRTSLDAGGDFRSVLSAMSEAAERGKNSTKDLQARIGRAARLGSRSIGVLDAGATSCCLILQSMSHSLRRQLD